VDTVLGESTDESSRLITIAIQDCIPKSKGDGMVILCLDRALAERSLSCST
jgi:hypothetical protein